MIVHNTLYLLFYYQRLTQRNKGNNMTFKITDFSSKNKKKVLKECDTLNDALGFVLNQNKRTLKITNSDGLSLYDDLTGEMIRKKFIGLDDISQENLEKVIELLDRPVIYSTTLNTHLTEIKKSTMDKKT